MRTLALRRFFFLAVMGWGMGYPSDVVVVVVVVDLTPQNNGKFKKDLKALVRLSELRSKSIMLLNKAGFE